MSTKLKAITFIVLGLVAVVIIISLTRLNRIEPGNVGVIVNSTGTDKGSVRTVGPGLYWLNFTEKMFTFPTFKQTYAFTDDKKEGNENDESLLLQTSDGLEFKARVAIIYTLDENKVAKLFQEYRMGIDEITMKYLRTIVRNEFISLTSQRKIDDVIGYGKNSLLDTLNMKLKSILSPKGIMLESVSLIGSFDLPASIKKQIELKLEAVQISEKRELEAREAAAKAKKDSIEASGYANALIIKATADARANELKRASLTDLIVRQQAIERWNGYLPTYISGKDLPFIGNISNSK